MNTLRKAGQQVLEALEYDGLLKKRQAITALRAALAQEQAEPVQEPVAWMYDCGGGGRMYAEALDGVPGWVPLYTAPPRCPNCASLEAQNDELDRKLAEMERAHEIIKSEIKGDKA